MSSSSDSDSDSSSSSLYSSSSSDDDVSKLNKDIKKRKKLGKKLRKNKKLTPEERRNLDNQKSALKKSIRRKTKRIENNIGICAESNIANYRQQYPDVPEGQLVQNVLNNCADDVGGYRRFSYSPHLSGLNRRTLAGNYRLNNILNRGGPLPGARRNRYDFLNNHNRMNTYSSLTNGLGNGRFRPRLGHGGAFLDGGYHDILSGYGHNGYMGGYGQMGQACNDPALGPIGSHDMNSTLTGRKTQQKENNERNATAARAAAAARASATSATQTAPSPRLSAPPAFRSPAFRSPAATSAPADDLQFHEFPYNPK